jgi:hypothetical protein
LNEMHCNDTEKFTLNRDEQLRMKADSESHGYKNNEPCWTCRFIAKALGME